MIAAVCALLFCTDSLRAEPHPEVHLEQVDYIMHTAGVEYRMVWEECGELNAYYSHGDKTVTMCTETLALPVGVVQYIYAHEVAHAIIVQRNLPYTGSHETAADELASVMMILYGKGDAIWESANWWYETNVDNPPWDDHADGKERGYRMGCLVVGSRGETEHCYARWVHARDSWLRLLGY